MLWSGLTRLFRLDDAGAEMVEADDVWRTLWNPHPPGEKRKTNLTNQQFLKMFDVF